MELSACPSQPHVPAGYFRWPWATFDEDGKLDAVVSINNSVAVLIANGNGTFQPPTNRHSPGGGQVNLLDLNLDRHLDVLTPTNLQARPAGALPK